MRRIFTILLVCVTAVTLLPTPTLRADEADVLSTLRPQHPRLLVLDDDLARLKRQVADDPEARRYFERIRAAGDELLDEPTSQRVLIGPRLLHVSRQVLARVATLGGLYRLSGDEKYARRCRDEMLAAAAFKDWNPSHFLDVAEMTNAMGIGYDWVFHTLTDAERATIRTAILDKGLKPGLKVYASGKGFPRARNNWNQVCNGGLTVGALAVADEAPEIARQILAGARQSLPLAMKEFAPQGGCVEGPAYWAYATRYMVFYGAALQTALGDDFGFLDSPGLAETGLFRIHSISPIRRAFNFADAGDRVGPAWQMFYFARAFDRPAYAAHERLLVEQLDQVDPFHLMWFNDAGSRQEIEQLPTAHKFDGIEVAMLRSAWADPQAAFVGFKGGDNAASHANLDLGTFVYDVDGVRWAIDLGPDDYNLPGYFSTAAGKRWTYYRLRTEGQNTLTLDGANQNTRGRSRLIAFSASPGRQFAIADLTDAYAGQATRVRRGVQLIGRQLLVQDELEADEPIDIVWHMHTAADISIDDDGRRAVLAQNGRRLTVQLVAGSAGTEGARFEIAPADPPPPVKPNPPQRRNIPRHARKLILRLPTRTSSLLLPVLLTPHAEPPARRSIELLDNWK